MREYSYRLRKGTLDEVEKVIFTYTSVGWTFKELLPSDGTPQEIIFIWKLKRPPFYPPVYIE